MADDAPATARELGLMQGAPPPASRHVSIENFLQPPYNRWSLRHLREIAPTRAVSTGRTTATLATRPLDLDSLKIEFPDGRSIAVRDWLESAYTDGFIVLHRGDIVYEKYFNDHRPTGQHLMFSVTKSFTGTLMLMLIEQGRVDSARQVADYVPELAETAFGDATVQHVLDMTNSIHYIEDYYNPEAHITGFLDAMLPGGEGLYSNLETLTEPWLFWRQVDYVLESIIVPTSEVRFRFVVSDVSRSIPWGTIATVRGATIFKSTPRAISSTAGNSVGTSRRSHPPCQGLALRSATSPNSG